jgi:hypothetical protein
MITTSKRQDVKCRCDARLITTAARPPQKRAWVHPFLAAFVAVLATVFGAATASAATTAGAETRVGASSVVVEPLVEPPERIAAGQRLGNEPSRVVTAVATGVAAKTDGWLSGRLAMRDERGSIGSPFGRGGGRPPSAASKRNVDAGSFRTREDAWNAAVREQSNYRYAKPRVECRADCSHVHLDIYNKRGEVLETRHYNHHQAE